ncbi:MULTISPECIES: hypothetical protein [Parabacteroides]|uniref:Lipoprotein n=3 Tax=Parabacteroides goldsteinii TaxID=328812 RepID=A0A6G1ZCQ3_9BACT|nr:MULTISPECIES: hypothetical protein [Parabacteroides]EOS17884.1 hypothetical protein C803_02090 [Parabacteroides goldsteinii dnLKV18]KAI4360273.1 hypothetical protein C825_002325 [Parabacteroides sp. ASF519]MBF0762915.1 hypothetical protein [Parabacteroides goldsteinii]MDZ3928873.1 hypothetical protein [Parabacteroides goldsteinii]MRX92212.1 hypothetical protein [Parabacteroides goldsteinii]
MRYYILLLGLFLLGCKNQPSKQDTTFDLGNRAVIQKQDTIEQIKITDDYKKLFQELSLKDYIYFPKFKNSNPDEFVVINGIYGLRMLTENEDTCDLTITWRIKEYAQLKGFGNFNDVIVEYQRLREIIDSIKPKKIDIEDFQLNDIDCILEHYLCYHYWVLLNHLPKSKALEQLLNHENKIWNDYCNRQIKTLDAFICSRIGSGSICNSIILIFRKVLYNRRLNIILELYFALINEKYTPKQTYKPLENRIFEKEYNFFLKALLDTDFYFNDEYSLEEQRYILLQEQEMWNNLMNIRNKISKHLTGNAKYVYNNATYHLQKQHLVELKNEYGEYGVTGAEYQKLLLTDSCSYEELLNTKRPRVILQERWK